MDPEKITQEVSEKYFKGRELGEAAGIVFALWVNVLASCNTSAQVEDFADKFVLNMEDKLPVILEEIERRNNGHDPKAN